MQAANAIFGNPAWAKLIFAIRSPILLPNVNADNPMNESLTLAIIPKADKIATTSDAQVEMILIEPMKLPKIAKNYKHKYIMRNNSNYVSTKNAHTIWYFGYSSVLDVKNVRTDKIDEAPKRYHINSMLKSFTVPTKRKGEIMAAFWWDAICYLDSWTPAPTARLWFAVYWAIYSSH